MRRLRDREVGGWKSVPSLITFDVRKGIQAESEKPHHNPQLITRNPKPATHNP